MTTLAELLHDAICGAFALHPAGVLTATCGLLAARLEAAGVTLAPDAARLNVLAEVRRQFRQLGHEDFCVPDRECTCLQVTYCTVIDRAEAALAADCGCAPDHIDVRHHFPYGGPLVAPDAARLRESHEHNHETCGPNGGPCAYPCNVVAGTTEYDHGESR